MKLLWTLVAAAQVFSGRAEANEADTRTTLVNAKDSVVAAALAVRQARLDWERARALVDEAEAGLEAAHLRQEKAFDQGQGGSEAAESVGLAEQRWQQALLKLDVEADRLSEAENRLQAAQTTLTRAEMAWAKRGP